MTPYQSRFATTDVWIGLAVFIYTAVLVALPLLLETATSEWLFSEEGAFEQLSIVWWLCAVATVLVHARPLGRERLALALLFAVFAAREADWHKAFTAGSLLSLKYYGRAEAPFGEKLAAGLIAGAIIVVIAYAGFRILRFLFVRQGWRTRTGFWLLLASSLMVLGKLLDRAPAVLTEEYGVPLSSMARLYANVFEEGYEMLHPLLMAWAMWLGQRQGLFDRSERLLPARVPGSCSS